MSTAIYQNHRLPLYLRLATATTEWNHILSAGFAPLATVLIATSMLMTVMAKIVVKAMAIAVLSQSQTTPVLEACNSLDATDLKCYVPVAMEATVDLAIAMPVHQNHLPLQYSSTVMAAAV